MHNRFCRTPAASKIGNLAYEPGALLAQRDSFIGFPRSFAQYATTVFFPHLVGDACRESSRISSAKGALAGETQTRYSFFPSQLL